MKNSSPLHQSMTTSQSHIMTLIKVNFICTYLKVVFINYCFADFTPTVIPPTRVSFVTPTHMPTPPASHTHPHTHTHTHATPPASHTHTQSHNVYTESPATYWSDNIGNATGVSQVKVQSAPFHKNSAFSTPIEDYLDQPKPHGID